MTMAVLGFCDVCVAKLRMDELFIRFMGHRIVGIRRVDRIILTLKICGCAAAFVWRHVSPPRIVKVAMYGRMEH